MRTQHRRKDSDVVKIETYNSIKDQLELENANLLRQREQLQHQSQFGQSYAPPHGHPHAQSHKINNSFGNNLQFHEQSSPIQTSPSQSKSQYRNKNIPQYQAQSQSQNQGSSSTFIPMLKQKIFQIINLCQSNQYVEIAQAQKQILMFLDSLAYGNRADGEDKRGYYGEFGTGSGVGERVKSSRKKKSKHNRTEIFQSKEHYAIGDQAMELIEDIERKALIQIQNLRNDKISLMKRLNEEIKAYNQQKKLRISLQNQLKSSQDIYRRAQRNTQMQVVDEQNQQSYQAESSKHEIIQSNRKNANKLKSSQNRPKSYSNFHPSSTGQNPQNFPQPQPQSQYQSQPEQIQPLPLNQPQPQYPSHQTQPILPSVITPKNSNRPVPSQGYPHPQSMQTPMNRLGSSVHAPNSQHIAQEVQRLRQENQRLKQQHSNAHPDLKYQLKSEINQLQAKIGQYQGLLTRRNVGSIDFKQLQNLMIQANNITQQGNRLLSRKPANYRSTAGSYGLEQPTITINMNPQRQAQGQGRATFDNIRPPLQTFSPMDKSYHSQNYYNANANANAGYNSYTNMSINGDGKGFSPTQYEKLIQEMNYVTKV